jgi:hypothetical protein|tara:strand:- start:936 stop:1121 length:186 start_codon:yes stop_codon:yes gene_type:complete
VKACSYCGDYYRHVELVEIEKFGIICLLCVEEEDEIYEAYEDQKKSHSQHKEPTEQIPRFK